MYAYSITSPARTSRPNCCFDFPTQSCRGHALAVIRYAQDPRHQVSALDLGQLKLQRRTAAAIVEQVVHDVVRESLATSCHAEIKNQSGSSNS